MNAICLVLDQLHAGHVGAYGNAWIRTPALDRLAAQSAVLDHALIDSPDLAAVYRSYWQGWHALCPQDPPGDRPSLAALMREASHHTALLTDDKTVAEHPLAVDFDELIEIDPPWEPGLAEEIEQTHFGRCFVEVIDWLQSAREPFVLWCHLAGLGTAWNAPLDFRSTYREEGDPESSESAEVPEATLAKGYDPDDVLPAQQAYAGQVTLLDTCLGILLDVIEGESLGGNTMLAVTAARGYPLGEHRRLGLGDMALYEELVHVPLMLRMPDGLGAASRSQALCGPADLWATLLDGCGIVDGPQSPTAGSLLPILRGEAGDARDRLALGSLQGARAIRTPAWYLRCGDRPELFAKPDDRWEVNDVADRCREVVECLQDVLRQYEQALQSGSVDQLPQLSDVLLHGLD